MAMEQLNPPTQIFSMLEINLQCGDQILKSTITQRGIILDWCFITGLYDSKFMTHLLYDKRVLFTHASPTHLIFISFKQTLVKIFRIRSKRNWWMWQRINGRLFWNVLKKVSGKIIKPNLERHVSALVEFSKTPYGGFPLRSSYTRSWGHHHTTPACVRCMISFFEEHLKFMK